MILPAASAVFLGLVLISKCSHATMVNMINALLNLSSPQISLILLSSFSTRLEETFAVMSGNHCEDTGE